MAPSSENRTDGLDFGRLYASQFDSKTSGLSWLSLDGANQPPSKNTEISIPNLRAELIILRYSSNCTWWAGPRASARDCTVYSNVLWSSCRRHRSWEARVRSAVRGGAGAPARNSASLSTLSQIPRTSAWGVHREELREGLQHVRVLVGLLE